MVRVAIIDRSAARRVHLSRAISAADGVSVVSGLRPRSGVFDGVAHVQADVVVFQLDQSDDEAMSLLESLGELGVQAPVVVYSADATMGSRLVQLAREARCVGCLRRPADEVVAQRVVQERLLPLVAAVGRASSSTRSRSATTAPQRPASASAQPAPERARPPVADGTPARPVPRRAAGPPSVVLIGCSTGGPNALSAVLPLLPEAFPVPVLVVQHMPPRFTRLLAQRLDQVCALTVCEASAGEPLSPGTVYLAPGGQHLRVETVRARQRLTLDSAPPVNSCRPSVDVLFQSAVDVWGGRICAAILTGMGLDGLEGARAVVGAGGHLIAQDEASSVVYGMPKAVAEAGLAHEILPVDAIGEAIVRAVRRDALGMAS